MTKSNKFDLVNESDRGCVLVGAAILENRLEEIFRCVFDDNKITKTAQGAIFEANGPLATFSAKIKMAYSLGYITKSIYEDLEKIRKIRNDFAHSTDEVDFIGNEVTKIIESMHCVQEFKGKLTRYTPSKEPEDEDVPRETIFRSMGFVKYTKSLFSLGVHNLEIGILTAILAMKQTHHLNRKGEIKN